MHRLLQAGKLEVRIYDSRKEMGQAAAATVVERILRLQRVRKPVNIIFAAAPSQAELLEALRFSPVDWSGINAFHMDEYLGLSPDAPQQFGVFLRERLFAHLPFNNVFYINGNTADAAVECSRYQQLLVQYPPDIVCMGIGENGHIAFNDPPVADFNDPLKVKVVVLDEMCRQQQVNDGCFLKLADVPQRAITLTVPALLSASFICCTVPGPTKATAVHNTLFNKIIPAYPSTILRTHLNAILFTDAMAAAKLTNEELEIIKIR